MGAYLALCRCTKRYPARRAVHSPEMLTRNESTANRSSRPFEAGGEQGVVARPRPLC